MNKFKYILHHINTHRLLEVILVFIAFLYYLFFLNKGLVLFDEGYFVHAAERILNGEIPYKDFSLQYGPTYFYLLAFFLKLFGTSIIVERSFALTICLLILITTFLIINKLRANLYHILILSFFCIIAYGYPLINIPNIMWANVLTALLTLLAYLQWYSSANRKRYIYSIIMGALLALSLSLKQNIGITCVIIFNLLVIFSKKRPVLQTILDIVIINGVGFIITFGWLYYFFLKDNIAGLFAVIEFSKNFAGSMAFTLPPLTFIMQPLGIFKLLPYYTPIIFFISLLYNLLWCKKDWQKLAFALIAVAGFATTIFPQSDLLHVYPFLGPTLVALLLFGYKSKLKFFIISLLSIHILIGFYLTLFTKSYRYETPYLKMDTELSLPRTKGIIVEKKQAIDLTTLSNFINTHTKKNDYILAYPYAPMLYFILERNNPTKDPIYYLRAWHFYDDELILKDIKQKNVKYIVVAGEYRFDTELSYFIQKQKNVLTTPNYSVYEINRWK